MPTPLAEEQRLLRALLYGPLGLGKTSLAGKVFKAIGGRTLTVTADSAWSVLLGIEDLDIERLQYKSGGEGTTFAQLDAVVKEYGDGTYFQNLLLDPVSSMIDSGRRHWTKMKKFKDQKDPLVSGWTHYNLVKDTFADIIDPLSASALNIIYITHDQDPSEADEDKGRLSKKPNLPWQTYNKLGQDCNLMGYCFKKEQGQKFLIQTEGTARIAAKSQIPGVPQGTFPQDDLPQMIADWMRNGRPVRTS